MCSNASTGTLTQTCLFQRCPITENPVMPLAEEFRNFFVFFTWVLHQKTTCALVNWIIYFIPSCINVYVSMDRYHQPVFIAILLFSFFFFFLLHSGVGLRFFKQDVFNYRNEIQHEKVFSSTHRINSETGDLDFQWLRLDYRMWGFLNTVNVHLKNEKQWLPWSYWTTY